MTEEQDARIRSHQRNLNRYCRLLATDLTEIERQFIHKRIVEERLKLDLLRAEGDPRVAAFVAAQTLAK